MTLDKSLRFNEQKHCWAVPLALEPGALPRMRDRGAHFLRIVEILSRFPHSFVKAEPEPTSKDGRPQKEIGQKQRFIT